MELFELLEKLHGAFGPSGDEAGVRELIKSIAAPYADEMDVDVMGNLIVRKRGEGPKLMLCAHMDSIGFVVTHIDEDGLLRCGRLGGVDPKAAIFTPVRFKNGTRGVFARKEGDKDEKWKIDDCFIDIGARSREEAERLVQIGDIAVYDTPINRCGGRAISPYMDNRVSCAILLCALESVEKAQNDAYFVFSAQEEVGLRGAKTAAYAIAPRYGVVVDVTDSGDLPDGERMGSAKLGGGAAIKIMDRSVIAHPEMVKTLEQLAKQHGIPAQRDIIDAGGTDAGVIQAGGTGVVTGGISVPCRYIHTPSELVDMADAEACVRLTAALVETCLPL